MHCPVERYGHVYYVAWPNELSCAAGEDITPHVKQKANAARPRPKRDCMSARLFLRKA